jgi:hypothetical protein
MFELRNEIEIKASADRVWRVLTDFARYAEWNPHMLGVVGQLRVGQPVALTVKVPEGERTWACHVVKVDLGQEFAWTFTDRLPLLYRGQHTFRLEPVDQHTTRYVDREIFQGLLVPRHRHHLETTARAEMVAMGQALKQRSENTGTTA